jgi:hypothetical protein
MALLLAMVTKTPFAKVSAFQKPDPGKVRLVQVPPSVEVAATALLYATATNTPFP